MNDAPQLSIVTGTINRPEQLQRLVQSIAAHTSVSWELIVSDASEAWDNGMEAVALADARITYIHESPRLGHVRGYNRAFSLCRGEYVIWLNDDAEVLPGYDTRGIATLANPDVGLGAFYYLESGKWHVNMLYRMIFANFGIIRRELGNAIGWFDEDFEMYGGDNSLTFRVLMAGKGVVTVPGASIIHHSERDAMRIENEKYRIGAPALLDKNYGPHRARMQQVYAKTAHLVGPRVLPIVEER